MFTLVHRRQKAAFCLGSWGNSDTCEHIVVALNDVCFWQKTCGQVEEPGGKSCLEKGVYQHSVAEINPSPLSEAQLGTSSTVSAAGILRAMTGFNYLYVKEQME